MSRRLQQVHRFARLAPREQVRAEISWVLLAASRLLILALPFSVVRRMLGRHDLVALAELHSLDDSQTARARAIGAAVQRAAEHTPWQSTCYPQALASRAQLVVSRIPHAVSFGLRRDTDGNMVAHAWVRAGEVAVCGGDGRDYVVVGSFSWSPRPSSR